MKNLWRRFKCKIGFHYLLIYDRFGIVDQYRCANCYKKYWRIKGSKTMVPWDARAQMMSDLWHNAYCGRTAKSNEVTKRRTQGD